MVLIEDLKQTSEAEEPYKYEKQTLLSKYQIPLQNLEFKYIEKCQNGRELEKILHILRSGEEGHYPDLIKTAEKKLAEIKPNSKFLRKVSPVLSKNEINMNEWQNLSQDLNDWVEDINKKDRELEGRKIKFDTQIATDNEIRKGTNICTEIKPNPKRIASTDYESWDKYDPDTEILKMDLEDEKLKKEALKMQEEEKEKKAKTVRFNNFATEAEAIFEANREKERGNECFKAKEYQTALQHYTNSLKCKPLAAVYTNRALVFNKLKKFKKGIDDCVAALKLEPRNFKAHMRLAQNYEALEQYDEALKSIEHAIEIDPNNISAQELANHLNKTCGKISINKRFAIGEVDCISSSSFKESKNSYKTLPTKLLKPILKNNSKFESESNNSFNTNIKNDPTQKQINKEQNCINIKKIQNKNKEKCVNPNKLSPNVSNKAKATFKNPKNCNNESKVKNKNIMTKQDNYEIIPIPGTSKMPPPYYKIIESNDPEIIKREKQKILCRPTLLHLTIIDVTSDDEYQRDNSPIYQTKQATCIPTLTIRDVPQDSQKKNLKIINNVKISCGRNKHKQSQLVSRKNEKITENKNDQNEKGAGGEPFNEEQLIPTAEELQSPYTFIQTWNSIRKDTTYKQHAQILKKMDFKRIPDVIGYKLDDTMLSNIINCLYWHFMVPGELDNLHSILMNITRIPRFKTMSMFLEEADWKYISQLIEFLDQHGQNLPDDIKCVYYCHN